MPHQNTADMLAEMQERRRRDASERAAARLAMERKARRQFITRSAISYDALVTTMQTLRVLGEIDLADLQVPPGFNLLSDGDVGSVNVDTAEYQFWAQLDTLREKAENLSQILARAEDDLRVDGHQFVDRLARISAANDVCVCGHPGWVHADDGCIGQDRSIVNTVGAGQGFTRCGCKVTHSQHMAQRLAKQS